MAKKIKNIGEELLNHAEGAESSRRGVADDLFPYIYVAAKKLSTRAISRWLEDTQGIKLSAATVSKVLRESDERIKSHYLAVRKKEHELYCLLPHDPELPEDGVWCSALFNLPLFEDHMRTKPTDPGYTDQTHIQAHIARLYNALHEEWFSLPVEFQDECKKYANPYDLLPEKN